MERGDHPRLSRAVHGDRFLVLQNRLPAEELAAALRTVTKHSGLRSKDSATEDCFQLKQPRRELHRGGCVAGPQDGLCPLCYRCRRDPPPIPLLLLLTMGLAVALIFLGPRAPSAMRRANTNF